MLCCNPVAKDIMHSGPDRPFRARATPGAAAAARRAAVLVQRRRRDGRAPGNARLPAAARRGRRRRAAAPARVPGQRGEPPGRRPLLRPAGGGRRQAGADEPWPREYFLGPREYFLVHCPFSLVRSVLGSFHCPSGAGLLQAPKRLEMQLPVHRHASMPCFCESDSQRSNSLLWCLFGEAAAHHGSKVGRAMVSVREAQTSTSPHR